MTDLPQPIAEPEPVPLPEDVPFVGRIHLQVDAGVAEADALFGTRHFDRYEILFALSKEIGSIGVEHHRSCEAVTIPGYFTEWDDSFSWRDTIPHEFVHSWNGKRRRGADSWTPSFHRPIRNSLMRVYEGQTQYWTGCSAPVRGCGDARMRSGRWR